MKLFFIILGLVLILFPVQAATVYINSDRNIYVIVHPVDAWGNPVYYRGYGIHSGLGPNTGRTVTEYYPAPVVRGHRSEFFMNNSGTGAHGPGTY